MLKEEVSISFAEVFDVIESEVFLEKGIEPFLIQWKRYDLLENRQVSLSHGAKITSGIGRGITPLGFLLLELPSGEIQKFSYGDTTLLKS